MLCACPLLTVYGSGVGMHWPLQLPSLVLFIELTTKNLKERLMVPYYLSALSLCLTYLCPTPHPLKNPIQFLS